MEFLAPMSCVSLRSLSICQHDRVFLKSDSSYKPDPDRYVTVGIQNWHFRSRRLTESTCCLRRVFDAELMACSL
jgi:hypothetical protein